MLAFGFIFAVLLVCPGPVWSYREGISGFCEKALNIPGYAPYFPTSCCNQECNLCDTYIKGNETAYGLTNPERWTRSLCSCDVKIYNCIKNKLAPEEYRLKLRVWEAFSKQVCFEKSYDHSDTSSERTYQWVPITQKIRRPLRERPVLRKHKHEQLVVAFQTNPKFIRDQ